MAVSYRNVFLKGVGLFLVVNLLYALVNPLPVLGRWSLYNHLFPGRVRLPYGERPDLAYNLSLYNLEAMFASHEIAAPKPRGEFRVVLIGDSSTWGFLLEPEETLAAQLNARGLPGVRVYNLGYPTMSLTKDLLMLKYALDEQPDLVIWLVTLESFPWDKQFTSPIVAQNPEAILAAGSAPPPGWTPPPWWQRTIFGQRRALADLLRLQVYGILWAATGVDQYYPETYDPPQSDLEADETFHALQPPALKEDDLAFEVLQAGVELADGVPVLFVNEPIYISQGKNSDLRYNFFYPRWAYDQYRQMLTAHCLESGWRCLDTWDLVPAAEFTNSAIHRTPFGEALLAEVLAQEIEEIIRER